MYKEGAEGSARMLPLDKMVSKLNSYAFNIRQTRRSSQSSAATKAAASFVYALQTEASSSPGEIGTSLDPNVVNGIREALSKASVMAIRAAADGGNYKLILRIVDAVVGYGVAVAEHFGVPEANEGSAIIVTRIFGEAITCLTRSKASQSKLKGIWNRLVDLSREEGLTILASAPGPYELNAILAGLADRGRVKAALDIYRSSGIAGDSFTACILIDMLAASIPSHGIFVRRRKYAERCKEAQGIDDLESTCWQWNEVLSILDDLGGTDQLNNYVFTSALKANAKAENLYQIRRGRTEGRHNGGRVAVSLLRRMEKSGVDPDIITCTLAMKAFEQGGHWQEALRLLHSMEDDSQDMPPPNMSTYAAAISTCFQGDQEDKALELLDRASQSKLEEVVPNTWLYNTAILAHLREEDSIRWILNRMKESGIERNPITYLNAIRGCRYFSAKAAVGFLDSAFHDDDLSDISSTDMIALMNMALLACASNGDVSRAAAVFALMAQSCSTPDEITWQNVIKTFAVAGDVESVSLLVRALQGSLDSSQSLVERHDIEVTKKASALIQRDQLDDITSLAIASLLRNDNLDAAIHTLSGMESAGMKPQDESVREITFELCRRSMSESANEFKKARGDKLISGTMTSKSPLIRPSQEVSSRMASDALQLMKKIYLPSAPLSCAVTKACCAAGKWSDGRAILRKMHSAAVKETRSPAYSRESAPHLSELPSLHHQLFKLCARSGNVNAALSLADDIVDMSHVLQPTHSSSPNIEETCKTTTESISTRILEEENDPTLILSELSEREHGFAPAEKKYSLSMQVGMRGADWKLLIIAASKSADWRVCVNTLEFLRPFVEATNINRLPALTDESDKENRIRKLNFQYNDLSRAITAATLCLGTRSQYAWAMRATLDWIEWSGRRPPVDAVSAVCRVLAKRGKGQQVVNLVSRVLQVSPNANEPTYEYFVYTEAITALYRNGCYDRADELYASAVACDALPWAVVSGGAITSPNLTLDLHGMTSAVAHSAVRVALQREVQSASWSMTDDASDSGEMLWERDVVVITGRGKGSERRYRPVLRPEVQRMLVEEFYPPIGTSSIPGNMGALQLPSSDIEGWLNHQRGQKGKRLLAMADILKDLSGPRLKGSLEKIQQSQIDASPADGNERSE